MIGDADFFFFFVVYVTLCDTVRPLISTFRRFVLGPAADPASLSFSSAESKTVDAGRRLLLAGELPIDLRLLDGRRCVTSFTAGLGREVVEVDWRAENQASALGLGRGAGIANGHTI